MSSLDILVYYLVELLLAVLIGRIILGDIIGEVNIVRESRKINLYKL